MSRSQLRGLGLSNEQVSRAIATARLVPVHRAIFALGHDRLRAEGQWMAAVLACGGGVVLGYRSAAAHWDLRRTSSPAVEVVIPRSSRPAHRDVIVHRHPHLHPDEVTVHRGIPVTTPARTLVDLAAVLTPTALRRAVGQADILRRFDLREVRAVLERHPRHRGRTALERVLGAWTDAETVRSPQEASFPELCVRFGFPRPAINAELLGMEIDAVFFDERVAVELQSYAFHSGAIQWENDHEKRARLVASGWIVLAYSWRQQRDDGGRFVRDTLGPALARGRQRASSDSR
ncbi:MAG: hypothetical protein ITG02_07325 [Patulibacter sp.]|nr:hypothetical protein [Patulibacter sp.]